MALSGLAAAAPLLVIVALMLGLRWSAARAGTVGALVAFAVAWTAFGYGRTAHGDAGITGAAIGVLLEAAFTTATILWIVFPALCIHQLQARTGALEVLRTALGRLSDDPRIVALLVAWFFALFLEGAAGFGTPVALAAPFLVGLGYPPAEAVAITLIGHAVGVSFGAVGTPIVPQAAATGLAPATLAAANATFHGLAGWVMPLFLVALVQRSPLGRKDGAGIWGWSLLAALLFLLPYAATARHVGPELPTLVGALAGGAAFVLLLRVRRRDASAGTGPGAQALLRAAAPYLVTVLLILATRLVPHVSEALRELRWEWTVGGAFRGRVEPVYHPGTMLFLGFALAALWQGAPRRAVRETLQAAARQLLPVAGALAAMLTIARVMVHAGMIAELAGAAAAHVGPAWPALSPMIGVLGTFVTGSATASNVLFSDFQASTAGALGLPVPLMMGAQGFGAAVGNIICPHNIIAGVATVGAVGQEAAILRRTLAACLVYAALGGLLATLLRG